MEPRDKKILRHVARYRVTLRRVLDERFFPSSSGCGNVLARLLRTHYLLARPGLPRRLRYYQLSAKGAGVVGAPQSRTAPFGAQALREALAILWHCNLATQPTGVVRRRRLEVSELERLTKASMGSGPSPHLLEEAEGHRLFRVTVPSPSTKASSIVRGASIWMERTKRKAELRPWLESGAYAFLILADSGREQEIRAATQRARLPFTALVSSVPSPTSIGEALHEHRIPKGTRK